ncbi:hypothetical protein CHUAL_005969 [Chamberlinius hualienensis]
MMLALQCGSGINPSIMKQLVKDPSGTMMLNSWLLLIAIGNEGNVYSTSFNPQIRTNLVTHLFSLKQPIISIFQNRFNQNSLEADELSAVSFVGVLGKILMFTSAENPNDKRHEFYIPGPIKSFAGIQSISKCFYLTETAVWSCHFIFKLNQQQILYPTFNLVPNFNQDVVSVGTSISTGPCVLLFTGSGHLLKSSEKDFEKGFKFNGKNVTSRSDMLDDIFQSSLKLNEFNVKYLKLKKILEEFSCASHLKLNPNLRKTFTCSISTGWSCKSPNGVTICVRVVNSGHFSVVGSHWNLVTNLTSLTNTLTNSISLTNGVEVGKSVESTLEFEFNDILSINNFPINVNCGLQFVFEDSMAFFIDLSEWRIDELYYLEPQTNVEPPKIKSQISLALWEMADRRLQIGLNRLNRFKSSSGTSQTLKTLKCSLSVSNSKLMRILNIDQQDESLLKKTLIYLVKNSRNIDPALVENGEIAGSLFGVNFKMNLDQLDDFVNISISTFSPHLFIKLKCIIIKKLKLSEDFVENEENSTKRWLLSSSSTSSLNEKCQDFKRLIEGSECENEQKQTQFLTCLYDQMRLNISNQLPFT